MAVGATHTGKEIRWPRMVVLVSLWDTSRRNTRGINLYLRETRIGFTCRRVTIKGVSGQMRALSRFLKTSLFPQVMRQALTGVYSTVDFSLFI